MLPPLLSKIFPLCIYTAAFRSIFISDTLSSEKVPNVVPTAIFSPIAAISGILSSFTYNNSNVVCGSSAIFSFTQSIYICFQSSLTFVVTTLSVIFITPHFPSFFTQHFLLIFTGRISSNSPNGIIMFPFVSHNSHWSPCRSGI